MFRFSLILIFLGVTPCFAGDSLEFVMHRIGTVRTEACGVADFDNDGKPDVVAGEFVHLAPNWTPIKIRAIKSDVNDQGKGYAWDFANLPMDVDEDGFVDVVSVDWFTKKAVWFKHPGKDWMTAGLWKENLIEENGNFECADFVDLLGTGIPSQILPAVTRTVWYEKVAPGRFDVRVVSEKPLTFGGGVGDVNGDGRPDILRPNCWFEAPVDIRNGSWKEHPWNLYADAPEVKNRDLAQMYVTDVNKDGLPDVITGSAHEYGLFWFEQDKNGTETTWKRHVIDKTWSQVHSIALADLDGDGELEIVAGKRFMAHNGGDPGEFEPLGIYWYKAKRNGSEIVWKKNIISYDQGIGSGMNIVVVDMNGDGRPDIVTTGKFGGPVWFENKTGR